MKHLKAKITRIHTQKTQVLSRDMDDMGYVLGQRPSTYHLLQARRRQGMRAITEIVDTQGVIHKMHAGIVGTFVRFFLKNNSTR